jgi:hypothetical protein
MPAPIMSAVSASETRFTNGLNALMRYIGTSTASAVIAVALASMVIHFGRCELPSERFPRHHRRRRHCRARRVPGRHPHPGTAGGGRRGECTRPGGGHDLGAGPGRWGHAPRECS